MIIHIVIVIIKEFLLYRSVKCRFLALGILLGLILSLAAIIPIVVIWQTSKTGNIVEYIIIYIYTFVLASTSSSV